MTSINSDGVPILTTDDLLTSVPGYTQQIADYLAIISPIGMIQPYAGDITALEPYWLPCDGSIIPMDDRYLTLRQRIGHVYDPDARDYRTPDLRGRAPIGVGHENVAHNPGNYFLGTKHGDQRIPSHTHGISDPSHGHTMTIWYGLGPAFGATTLAGSSGGATGGFPGQGVDGAYTGISVHAAGTGGAANVSPSLAVNFVILAAIS